MITSLLLAIIYIFAACAVGGLGIWLLKEFMEDPKILKIGRAAIIVVVVILIVLILVGAVDGSLPAVTR